MKKQYSLNKYASAINRLSLRFYDLSLRDYHIGGGQQFFLVRIYENQGIGVMELAQRGYFDKATATRAIQKLEEQGYIRRESAPEDKRASRLYTTKKAEPIIERIYESAHKWNQVLTQDMSKDEMLKAEQLMARIAKNAHEYINHVRE